MSSAAVYGGLVFYRCSVCGFEHHLVEAPQSLVKTCAHLLKSTGEACGGAMALFVLKGSHGPERENDGATAGHGVRSR